MKARVFTLRYDRVSKQFDDAALCRFLETDAEAMEIREHFFECDGEPVWALLVSYRDTTDAAPPTRHHRRGTTDAAPLTSRREGYPARGNNQQELSADEVVRFEAARAWRNARASRDGKPPYILLTNRQLAAVAKHNPANLTALGEVPGIGDGKLRDFGNELLEVLAAGRAPSPQRCTRGPVTDTLPQTPTQEPHAAQ